MEAITQLLLLLGKDNVVVRYDYVRILMDILVKYLFLFLMIIKT